MEKRKLILLAVAGICIVGAGVLLYMNMGDAGPKPTPPPTLEQVFQDNPEVKKGYEQQQLQIQQNEKKGIAPAGS